MSLINIKWILIPGKFKEGEVMNVYFIEKSSFENNFPFQKVIYAHFFQVFSL